MDWCRVELSPQLQGVLKFKDMDEASVELGYEDDFDSLIEGMSDAVTRTTGKR